MNEDIKYVPEKLKAVIHYIISKCGLNNNVGRTVMYKLLYFSDFNFYELYETPITGEKYIKKPNGPISSHFLDLKEELISEGKIKEDVEKVIDYNRYRYTSLKEPDISCLNENEINVIDDTINRISTMSANEISDYSHGDMPWKVAENEEELDYEFVFYRDPEYVVREYDE